MMTMISTTVPVPLTTDCDYGAYTTDNDCDHCVHTTNSDYDCSSHTTNID